jgi:hypothetical protein
MKTDLLTHLTIILQVTGMTSGRAAALIPAGLGLISVIIGWIALRRSRVLAGKGRNLSILGLCLGLADLILSILHLVRMSNQRIGTGSGKLGAIVAIVFGVMGIFLCGLAIARARMKNAERAGK